MLAEARKRLAPHAGQLRYVVCDLTDPAWPGLSAGRSISRCRRSRCTICATITARFTPAIAQSAACCDRAAGFSTTTCSSTASSPISRRCATAGFASVECRWQDGRHAIVAGASVRPIGAQRHEIRIVRRRAGARRPGRRQRGLSRFHQLRRRGRRARVFQRLSRRAPFHRVRPGLGLAQPALLSGGAHRARSGSAPRSSCCRGTIRSWLPSRRRRSICCRTGGSISASARAIGLTNSPASASRRTRRPRASTRRSTVIRTGVDQQGPVLL